jgi:hypothetical protein
MVDSCQEMAVDEIKSALRPMFTRDLRTVEPTKSGLLVGENLRIYDGEPYELRFLRGTPTGSRQQLTDKLDQHNVEYKLGSDFSN